MKSMMVARLIVAMLALIAACAVRAQETTSPPAQVVIVETHNPVAAGVFSALIPGAGQAYNSQWEKALWFFGSSTALVWAGVEHDRRVSRQVDECNAKPSRSGEVCNVNNGGALLGWMFIANWAFGIVDAARSANHLNAEARAMVRPSVSTSGSVGLGISVAFQ